MHDILGLAIIFQSIAAVLTLVVIIEKAVNNEKLLFWITMFSLNIITLILNYIMCVKGAT